MRFEVTPVKICTDIVVWVMPPCSLVSILDDRTAPVFSPELNVFLTVHRNLTIY